MRLVSENRNSARSQVWNTQQSTCKAGSFQEVSFPFIVLTPEEERVMSVRVCLSLSPSSSQYTVHVHLLELRGIDIKTC